MSSEQHDNSYIIMPYITYYMLYIKLNKNVYKLCYISFKSYEI